MAINVVIQTNPVSTVQVRPQKSSASVAIVPTANITLGSLVNVDVRDADDGEALIYDSANNKYVIAPIIVDSNNITNVNGGTF
jgi:hypothetical protein